MSQKSAVIVVDFQADFTELRDGSLAVSGTGKEYVDTVIQKTREYKEQGLTVLATRDYHPSDHVSFFTSHPGSKPFDVISVRDSPQTLWPPHCVQETPGADILVPEELIDRVISTGYRSEFESYSGFRDDGGHDTGMKGALDELGVTSVIIYGLATDYCVRATVLDALAEGFAVRFKPSLSRAITEDGERRTLDEMRAKGATIED